MVDYSLKHENISMVKDLVPLSDPILHRATEPFNFSNPPMDPIDLAKQLTETMLNSSGLGLSANQIGLPYSVFVVTGEQIRAMFNPKIIDVSDEMVLLDEGCLSIPGIFIKVRRPKSVKIRYNQPNGEVVTEKYTGMTARVILHEYQHLQGRTMLDDCSIVQKEKAMKQLRKKK